MHIETLKLDEKGFPKVTGEGINRFRDTEDIEVPGPWIATFKSFQNPSEPPWGQVGNEWFWVMCQETTQVRRHVLDFQEVESFGPLWTYGFTSDKPFAVHYDDPDRGDCYVVSHNGCWNRTDNPVEMPQVKTPIFTRGTRGWRWVRIIDLARTLGENPQRIWDEYVPLLKGDLVSDGYDYIMNVVFRNPNRPLTELRFSVMWGAGAPHIHPNKIHLVWVPAGWAMEVCYLHALGCRPWETGTETSPGVEVF